MKTKLRTLLLIPFFALLMFTSCQDEVIDITQPTEAEALVATSELTSMISATSKMDGSADNIIDKASCLSVQLPVTVKVHGKEIIIGTKDDYKTIEAIYDRFEDDEDDLEIVFPITVILANHEEVVVQNHDALEDLIEDCQGEDEEDDDIECIDFHYPISFSVYNAQFQVVNVVTVGSDRELYRFIKRVINAEVFASLNFPVTLDLADGTSVSVTNNAQLAATIKEAKNACNEDDNNDYHDDDFSKERLDALLKTCPWVVHEFQRNASSLSDSYREYLIVFKEDNVVKVRNRNGDMLTGTWATRVTDRGALIKLEFDTLVDFTLEWFVYDLEAGRIKLYQAGGNRVILVKNCDVVVDHTKEGIENYLQECFWRIARLSVNGSDNEKAYIGTPLKFLANNEVKLRINGEFVTGTYEVGVRNIGFILQITLDGRPDLKLEWLITFLEPGVIKLENANNKMLLERHCLGTDDDLNYIETVLATGVWEVAKYDDGLDHVVDPITNFHGYSINFLESGRIKVTDPNNGFSVGSWLAYRDDGLYLGLLFANNPPFNDLTFRWRIKEISPNRIELKDLNHNGEVERILVLEKKN
ncbi:hypothetical protein [Mariniflexile sp. AS56]|uniref:hypothetical protein n=1 Tax=Mariniflexile sp. AS56 TaxID=3063957 RepID=UPI0026F08C5B|nr:hypothetical protein [Mariniflexile sp. AS56]MDO7171843.1 hypothetical protein [Mariniflexile sp. AS56]